MYLLGFLNVRRRMDIPFLSLPECDGGGGFLRKNGTDVSLGGIGLSAKAKAKIHYRSHSPSS